VDFPHDSSLGAIAGCQVPKDYQALQDLVQAAKTLGAVVTAPILSPGKRKVECSGLCGICAHADDCDTPYQNILGNQDFIPGVTIA